MKGKVIAISRSTVKGIPKDPIGEGEFLVNFGLVGDAHGGDWHRQVSFLGQESIQKMVDKGVEGLSPGKFAENITTEGILWYELEVGTKFRAGEVLFELTQIGKECHKHCAIYQQIGDCVMPREGIFAIVLEGGRIRPGDEIHVVEGAICE